MSELCRFFGIIIRMYHRDHEPPHIHVEYQGEYASVDFDGNVLDGIMKSRTALRLVRQWIDMHSAELDINWRLGRNRRTINRIPPLE